MSSARDPDERPDARRPIEVTAADLPLHCPLPDKRLWDAHPLVYLPFEADREQTCPYCGTVYVLVGAVESVH